MYYIFLLLKHTTQRSLTPQYYDEVFTQWDRFELRGEMTLQQLLDYFQVLLIPPCLTTTPPRLTTSHHFSLQHPHSTFFSLSYVFFNSFTRILNSSVFVTRHSNARVHTTERKETHHQHVVSWSVHALLIFPGCRQEERTTSHEVTHSFSLLAYARYRFN